MFRAFPKPRRTFASVSAATMAAAALSLSSDSQKKLSIYHDPNPEIILLDTPSSLELQIGQLRRRITQSVREARDEVQSVVDKWIGVEHAVETRVKSIISPNEQITPGFLYTGIGTLTGSIIARNRTLALRLFLPSALFVFSLQHFLPETTSNLSNYLGSIEEAYFPNLAQKHAIANAHTRMTWERAKEGTKEGREWVGRRVEWSVRRVEEVTGLKLSEVMGGGREVVKEVEKEVGREAEKAVEEAT